MDAVLVLMNAAFLAFVIPTMFSVGLATTVPQLTIFVQLVTQVVLASWLGKRTPGAAALKATA